MREHDSLGLAGAPTAEDNGRHIPGSNRALSPAQPLHPDHREKKCSQETREPKPGTHDLAKILRPQHVDVFGKLESSLLDEQAAADDGCEARLPDSRLHACLSGRVVEVHADAAGQRSSDVDQYTCHRGWEQDPDVLLTGPQTLQSSSQGHGSGSGLESGQFPPGCLGQGQRKRASPGAGKELRVQWPGFSLSGRPGSRGQFLNTLAQVSRLRARTERASERHGYGIGNPGGEL